MEDLIRENDSFQEIECLISYFEKTVLPICNFHAVAILLDIIKLLVPVLNSRRKWRYDSCKDEPRLLF